MMLGTVYFFLLCPTELLHMFNDEGSVTCVQWVSQLAVEQHCLRTCLAYAYNVRTVGVTTWV